MSVYWTYALLKAKVERDLDLEGESFINDTEMLGYANEAIDEIERQIHTLYEDYFLTRSTISLVSGTEAYNLPSDIYAMKIRSIIYRNGTQVWKLNRIRDWYKFEEYELQQVNGVQTQQYGFFVVNTTAGTPQLLLAPTPGETGAFLKIWYIRNANTLTVDASICDIPEAANYVMQYMKVKCYEKELHPNLQKAMADLEAQKADTLKTLEAMFPDNENTLEADTRMYEDMN